jgi:hypothetical protein
LDGVKFVPPGAPVKSYGIGKNQSSATEVPNVAVIADNPDPVQAVNVCTLGYVIMVPDGRALITTS